MLRSTVNFLTMSPLLRRIYLVLFSLPAGTIKFAIQGLLFLIRTSDKKKNCSEIVTLTPNLFENGKIKRCISCLFRCE